MRREKGKRKIGTLTAAIWPDCLETGRAQLLIQSTRRHLMSRLPGELRRRIRIARASDGDSAAQIQTYPFPLDTGAYADLIRNSDLGLFLYDSRRYYARASGILCEMLAAGVPVIVPAGGWLSEQVAGEINRHVKDLAGQSRWVVDQWEIVFGEDDRERCAICRVPAEAADLAIQWNWPAGFSLGAFIHLSVEFTGESNGAPLASHRAILDRTEHDRVGCVIPVPSGSSYARFRLCSAYSDETPVVAAVYMTALRGPSDGEHHPRGRVGLIAADDEQVPELVREILDHYPHYRTSAHEYSGVWLQEHHADRTLELLAAAMPIFTAKAA
jgi:hypothetical protein